MAGNYYQQLNTTQIKGPSTDSITPLNTQSYFSSAANIIAHTKQENDAKDLQDIKLNEYYQKKGEEEAQKQAKLHSLIIENAFKKDLEQLNTKYTDLTTPQQRENYRKELTQLYDKRNTILQNKTNPTLAYTAAINTDKVIKQQFIQKVKESTFNKLTQVYMQGANTNPVGAWKQTDNTYKQLISTAKTPEEKVAIMDAWVELKKTTSDDETFDRIQQNTYINKEIDNKIIKALPYLKHNNIKFNSIYTNEKQYKTGLQKLHNYAIRHGWDATTEERAATYLKYVKPTKIIRNGGGTGNTTNTQSIFNDEYNTTYDTANNSVKITKLPIVGANGKIISVAPLSPKEALQYVPTFNKSKYYGINNAIDKGITPEEFALNKLKIPAKYLDKDGNLKNSRDISFNIYMAYDHYKELYDLSTSKEQLIPIDPNSLDKNSKYIELPTKSGDFIKIPKNKISTIWNGSHNIYYLKSSTIRKFGNGKTIVNSADNTILQFKQTVNTKTMLPNPKLVSKDNYSAALSVSLTNMLISSGASGKNKISNAILATKSNKYLNINSKIVNGIYEHFKNNYKSNISKQDFFNKIFLPAKEKAIEHSRVYYNMKYLEKILPGVQVNVPKTINGIGSAHQYELKIEPFKIIDNPKNSIKFIRGLNFMASKNGDPISNYRDIVNYAKNEPEKFHDKFYSLLRSVGGCSTIGGLSSKCKIPYKNLNAIINNLRKFNTKD